MYFFLYCDCPHVNDGLKGRKNQDFAKCTLFLSILRVDFELVILPGNRYKTWPNDKQHRHTHTHTHTQAPYDGVIVNFRG